MHHHIEPPQQQLNNITHLLSILAYPINISTITTPPVSIRRGGNVVTYPILPYSKHETLSPQCSEVSETRSYPSLPTLSYLPEHKQPILSPMLTAIVCCCSFCCLSRLCVCVCMYVDRCRWV